jgi:hypothetical protein
MRCSFCATGKGGFARNLAPHEIADQAMTVQEHFGRRVSNVGEGAAVWLVHPAVLPCWKAIAQAHGMLSWHAACSPLPHHCACGISIQGWSQLDLAVFMGMGEPLLNLAGVLPAIHHLNTAMGIGARHITVSTVGVPNAIGVHLIRTVGELMPQCRCTTCR